MATNARDAHELLRQIDAVAFQAKLEELRQQRDDIEREIVLHEQLLRLSEVRSGQREPAAATPQRRSKIGEKQGLILSAMPYAENIDMEGIRRNLHQAGIPFQTWGTPLRAYLFRMEKDGLVERTRSGVYARKIEDGAW